MVISGDVETEAKTIRVLWLTSHARALISPGVCELQLRPALISNWEKAADAYLLPAHFFMQQ
jgi:hypothetical protein